ncbi:hypothetical protein [Sorangium sp. So ce385]|uniref:hypothetical protein n=1 Tax=Sorangium sp. So ce385 TaxID=3133308 RepID=UPI003F5BEC88
MSQISFVVIVLKNGSTSSIVGVLADEHAAAFSPVSEAALGWREEPRGKLTVTTPTTFGELHVLPIAASRNA